MTSASTAAASAATPASRGGASIGAFIPTRAAFDKPFAHPALRR
ncbi:hypothetical protein [Sphingomonas sp.]